MDNIQKQLEEIKRLLSTSNINTKDYLSVDETALYLNVSKSHLYKLTSNKEIPYYCPTGKKLYFKKEEIDEWIGGSKVSSISNIENEVELYLNRKNQHS